MTEHDDADLTWLDEIPALPWDDLEVAHDVNLAVLRRAARPRVLSALLDRVRCDPDLFAMAEHFDNIDQIVLYDALDRGFRIRLHLYPDQAFDRPHDHRWPLTNLIVHGRIGHELHQPRPPANVRSGLEVSTPTTIWEAVAEAAYTLDHRSIDNVVTGADTVALLMRGPSRADSFTMADRTTGRVWTRRGRALETPEEIEAKRMTTDRFDSLLARLAEFGLLDEPQPAGT
ncbi:hypothetical protein ABGB16_13330 [Micromonospora sp. B11E3]|uniref:hypothetical protein n=1 Tax=Micromonospora sp. B11E3 TaxID=3153562 RepID=UPI00325E048F